MMRGLGDVFARALVRRVAYVVVALVLAAIASLFAPEAKAGRLGCPLNNTVCDQGVALSVCQASASNPPGGWGPGTFTCQLSTNVYLVKGPTGNYVGGEEYYFRTSCASRNGQGVLADALDYAQTPNMTCVAGCKVIGQMGSTTAGGVTVVTMKDRTYDGSTCAPTITDPANPIAQANSDKHKAAEQKSPECTALANGQTGCVKPNGDYCATASSGKTFCWTPTETGEKKDGTQAQKKTVKDQPVTQPSINVPDTEWQRLEGHQQTTCLGTTCITYNVTNFNQVPAGTAKNSTGNNAPDGSGNPTGNGNKGEEGKDSASDSGNCDTPPVCVGDTLKCLQLKFTWKINCHTEKNEVTNGGTCAAGDIPVCAGKSCKAEEYAQVLQQWRARCAAEEQRQKASNDAGAGATDGAGDDTSGTVASLWAGDGVVPTLNQNRISIGGGEVIPTVDLPGGGHFTIPQEFYNALAIIKKIIIAAAMVAAFAILWNRL